jgi:hypothetical protein
MCNWKLGDSELNLNTKPLHKNILCLTVAYSVVFTAKVVKWKSQHSQVSENLIIITSYSLFCFWPNSPPPRASSFLRFLDHTQRRSKVGRTPLDEWSARRRDLYLTTHKIHTRQISISPGGFEPTISASERPQTYVLDRAATGTGCRLFHCYKIKKN